MTPVRWTPQARRDRFSQLAYIVERNPSAAVKLGELIRAGVSRLVDHPAAGRPGRLNGTRELPIVRTPYLVVYRITRSGVEILRFMHGAQEWPPSRGLGS